MMKYTAPSIAAAIMLAAALLGCHGGDGLHQESPHGPAHGDESVDKITQTVPMGQFSAVIPGELTLDPYGRTYVSTLYEDGCVDTDTKAALSSDGLISFAFSEVRGRDFAVVRDWAAKLPGSATGQKSAKAFGMGEDVAGAEWDDPVFYDAAGGDGIAVSYVLDGMRTTVHFVDLGEGSYAEARGTFPNAAYARDPDYFDDVFNSIATDDWMDSWTGRGEG